MDIRCHARPCSWRQPDREAPFRVCPECGSIHPSDLLRLDETMVTMVGSDWRSGWPYKFELRMGGQKYWDFYSIHLKDLDERAFADVAATIQRWVGIRFLMDGETLRYGQAR